MVLVEHVAYLSIGLSYKYAHHRPVQSIIEAYLTSMTPSFYVFQHHLINIATILMYRQPTLTMFFSHIT